MSSFRESPQAHSLASDVELSVHVLTQGYWPTYPPVEVKLPQEVLKLQEVFSTYYTTKHNGRRLQWHPYLGHSVLKANFPQGKKELVVSLLQAIVLLLFNEDESISYREILSATAIDDKELKVCLQSLACGKQRVLRKEPKGREVAEDDVFFFDVTFKTPVRRSRSPGCHTCTCATRCARSSKLAAPCLLPVVCSAVHSFTVSRSTPSRCEKQSKRMSRRQNVSSRIVAIRSMVRCPSLKNAVCLGLILTER